ncbi:sensor histidine kinase [Vaginisenegalia massiliensis]|uniref:sensor histidine kinase n=1 Tax=Vaginisenegalia massiliensis TaxID=2058294 RepID=UPI000F53F933|nr:HAMP domain-containing sensor histidine kinase [Vaginisenegalia massiliensis]
MNMLRSFTRLFIRYMFLILGLVSVGIVLFMGLSFYHFYQESQQHSSPNHISSVLINNKQEIVLNDTNRKLLAKEKIWMMVLDQNGKKSLSYRTPTNLPQVYSNNDIVRFTRWYLQDYPVFCYPIKNQLLVLGYPKGVYDKFPDNYYRFQTLKGVFFIGIGVLIFILCVLFGVYYYSRLRLDQELIPINQAINDLQEYQPIHLDVEGNFSEIKETLNRTSQMIQENRENRDHWIRGVSHDLRNPLTLIMSQTRQIELEGGHHESISKIHDQVAHMQEIISNLNLIYILDSPQPKDSFKRIAMDAYMRTCLSEFMNQYPMVNLCVDLKETHAYILGDKILIKRAIHNLLLNSLMHNNNEVEIKVSMKRLDAEIVITLQDNGQIGPQEVVVLNHKERNYSSHGMGTLISKQIIQLHKGTLSFYFNQPGLRVLIHLPIID